MTARSSSALIPVFSSFALFGLLFGVWQVILPDLQQALRLSSSALGAALTTGFLASFPVMLVGGRLADRWGARTLIVSTALLMALAFLGLVVVDRYWLLLALLLVFFGASGAFDVGINTAAIGVEQITGRQVMAYFHAAFSGTAALAALSTGFIVFAGVPFRWLYLGVAVCMVSLGIMVWWSAALPRAPAHQPQVTELPGRQRALYRVPAIILLAGITALATIIVAGGLIIGLSLMSRSPRWR